MSGGCQRKVDLPVILGRVLLCFMSLLLIFLQLTTGSIIFLNPYDAIRPKRIDSEAGQSCELNTHNFSQRTVID